MTYIFFDNAATTQTDPRVVEKMLPYFTKNFGNPSGMHTCSRKAKKSLNIAREKVASILNCHPEEIIFTGSGTESDNLAIFGITEQYESLGKKHLLTSKIEHHAVLYPFEKLQKKGWNVDFLSPNQEGNITPDIFKNALTKESLFASIIYANNELGTINDIPALAEIAQEKDIILHSDACQAGCSLDLDTKKLGVDLLTLNGSKIRGPKGVGVLFKKKNKKITPQLLGGGQEFGLRSGTENMPGIIGFTEALSLAQQEKEADNKHLRKLQKRIIDFTLKNIPISRLNGPLLNRLPNNIHFSFLNVEGESLLLFLDEEGFAVATGSACSTHDLEASHVLTGIGMPHEVAHGSLRITLGKNTTEEQIESFLKVLPKVVEHVRKISAARLNASDFSKWFRRQ